VLKVDSHYCLFHFTWAPFHGFLAFAFEVDGIVKVITELDYTEPRLDVRPIIMEPSNEQWETPLFTPAWSWDGFNEVA
jgi:hypothetical protein